MPSGARHFTGSSKRVEAHPKSSNLVVNSVALSRDLPVFTGFFEIIRVVIINNQVNLLRRLYDQRRCVKSQYVPGKLRGVNLRMI